MPLQLSASLNLTGSLNLSGSMTATQILNITASVAQNSISSSYISSSNINGTVVSSSYSLSSSFAPTNTNITSSWSINSLTASYALNATSGSTLQTGSTYPITSSWANNVVSSSHALTASVLLGSIESASYAATASYSLNSSGTELTTGSTYPITSSWANNVLNSISSSYATTASFVVLTNTATGSINFGFASSGENSFAETTILAPWVTTSSLIHIRVTPSNDHDRIDSLLDGLIFSTENIINGISFDIYCHALNNTWGTYNIVATEQKSNI